MSKKKKLGSVYDSKGNLIVAYFDLPSGYFYKGKFYSALTKLFSELMKDGITGKNKYLNGTWEYKGTIYASLQDVYESNEDDFAIPKENLKGSYKEFGIYHNPSSCVKYYYEYDEEHFIYDNMEEPILEYKFELGNCRILGDEEQVEEDYFQDLTNEEIVAYCKKPIKERIVILEQWLKGELELLWQRKKKN